MIDVGHGLKAKIFGLDLEAQGLGFDFPSAALAFYLAALLTSLDLLTSK